MHLIIKRNSLTADLEYKLVINLVVTNKFYEWWKNNRIFITLGGFIILFGLYLSPVIKEAKFKNSCIRLSSKGALNKFNEDNIREKLLIETGLDIQDLAKIEGYRNCI